MFKWNWDALNKYNKPTLLKFTLTEKRMINFPERHYKNDELLQKRCKFDSKLSKTKLPKESHFLSIVPCVLQTSVVFLNLFPYMAQKTFDKNCVAHYLVSIGFLYA